MDCRIAEKKMCICRASRLPLTGIVEAPDRPESAMIQIFKEYD